MCIKLIVCYSGCDVKNFEINLTFIIKPFPLYDQNVNAKKIKYIENEKSF